MESDASNASNASNAINAIVPGAVKPEQKENSFFTRAMTAVKGLKPEPSAIQQAKDELELKELQLRIKQINREMAAMNAAPSAPSAAPSAPSAAPSEAAGPAQSKASIAAAPVEEVPVAAPSAAQDAEAPIAAQRQLFPPVGSSQRAGRSIRRTRRLRASKKSPRQRVRE
jgi:hypothetical protein